MSSKKQLLLGIDLGTSRTAVVSSAGDKFMIDSVVGYPRDLVGLKLLGSLYAVGQDAMKNHSFLDLVYPLEDGVLRVVSSDDAHPDAASHLFSYIVERINSDGYDEVCAVIGAPARASEEDKARIQALGNEHFDLAVIVSEPFMVAYGQDILVNAIVVDIGAGTIDLCALRGAKPAAHEQVTLVGAGDHIDHKLVDLIQEKFPGVQVNKFIARGIKEQHGFVGEANGALVKVSLRINGIPEMLDITEVVREACESIIPGIIESVELLMNQFPPEDQSDVLANIVVAGGGSKIQGLDLTIAEGLKSYGDVRVTCVGDPAFSGCEGALQLGQLLPTKLWNQLG
ncbi:MAG: rod shape-determining protein [Zetaproteobacteria bacterium]|nr:rod shape-determining protein [Zetaproteobacteria bacterium]